MEDKEILEGQKEETVEQKQEPTPAPEEVAEQPADETSTSDEIVTPTPEPELKEENGAIETSIKTFTQDDVDKMIGDTRVKTREKTFRYVYDRYGVKDEAEMDALVANAQKYDTQKELYDSDKAAWDSERKDWDTERDENSKKLADMSETIALMQSDIAPERYEDAKLILKGKGLEVTLENINAEIATHPEWKKVTEVEKPAAEEKTPPVMRIKALGNEKKPAQELSEEEEAQKLFKLKW